MHHSVTMTTKVQSGLSLDDIIKLPHPK